MRSPRLPCRLSPCARGAWLPLLLAGAATLWASAEAAVDRWTAPYPGVRHLSRTTTVPQRIHALLVDLNRRDLQIRATRPADRRTTVSTFAARCGCQLAVNGDFFSFADYSTVGLAVGRGERWPGTRDTASHGFVAAGPGNRVEIPALSDTIDPPAPWMTEVVGGNRMLVIDGRRVDNSGCGSFCARHPRTAVGLDAGGRTLLLVLVDGRSAQSVGATLNELGDLLVELGAHRAINLDGGGSSAMFIGAEGGIVNQPSDGRERVVANHLGIAIVPTTGTITGFIRAGDIYDPASGIAGARVTASTGHSATTAADGRYTLSDVPEGDVALTASARGFANRSRTVRVTAGRTTWGSIALVPADAEEPAAPDAGQEAPPSGQPDMDPASEALPTPEELTGCQLGGRPRPYDALGLLALALLALCRRRPRPPLM